MVIPMPRCQTSCELEIWRTRVYLYILSVKAQYDYKPAISVVVMNAYTPCTYFKLGIVKFNTTLR